MKEKRGKRDCGEEEEDEMNSIVHGGLLICIVTYAQSVS